MTPVRRTILTVVLLLPFLVGSNRCLVGALGYGGPMKCLSVPAAQADVTQGHCCHGPAAGEKADVPAAPGRSCCIEAVPVPAGAVADGPAVALAAFVTPAAVDGDAPDATLVPFERAACESPPLPPEGPPAPSRAPPRA